MHFVPSHAVLRLLCLQDLNIAFMGFVVDDRIHRRKLIAIVIPSSDKTVVSGY